MKADLATFLKTELGQLSLSLSRNCLYQRPYPDAFDLVSYPTGWRVSDFVKFSNDDNRSTWEHISQYVAQFGEASVGVLLSGSPRGIPRRVVVSRDLPRSKRDGARNTKI